MGLKTFPHVCSVSRQCETIQMKPDYHPMEANRSSSHSHSSLSTAVCSPKQKRPGLHSLRGGRGVFSPPSPATNQPMRHHQSPANEGPSQPSQWETVRAQPQRSTPLQFPLYSNGLFCCNSHPKPYPPSSRKHHFSPLFLGLAHGFATAF